jgi:hypothetical protein
VTAGFDLTDVKKVNSVIGFIKNVMSAHRLTQGLVVFDTLNRMLGMNDENSSSVIGAFLASASRIAKECNAASLVIHHTGKGNSSTPRGSSAIEGNVDNLYYLARSKEDKKLVFWKPQKTKAAAESETMAFRITSHFVGTDNDGVDVSVPKAVPQGSTGFGMQEAANENRRPKSAPNDRVEEVHRILTDEHRLRPASRLMSPEIATRTGAAFRDVKDNRDSLLKAVKRSLAMLVKDGQVDCADGGYGVVDCEVIDQGQNLT